MTSVTELFESDIAAAIKADSRGLQQVLSLLKSAYPSLNVKDHRQSNSLPTFFEREGPTVVLLSSRHDQLGRVLDRTDAQPGRDRPFAQWLAIAPPSFEAPDALQWAHAKHLEELSA